ncbi:RNA polymerase sigma factor [Longispora albida]|uniref:RNA polymerase sigma factor n=1 Tax=Longispora albida TaxID=203523 RepID=UPI0003755529|nr:RNA polymerase sigma factor [Longispora albida]
MVAELVFPGEGDPEDVSDVGSLYAKHHEWIFRYAHRRVGPRGAAEALSRVFEKVAVNPDYDPGRGSVEAWLYWKLRTVLRRMGREEARDAKAGTADQWQFAAEAASPDIAAEYVERAALREAILRLPHDEKEALLLVHWDGRSYEEAAAMQRVPVGTVKTRVHRACRKIAKRLGRQEEA